MTNDHANDNEKSEVWFCGGWDLAKRVAPDLYKRLRKKIPDHREEQSICNFLWFIRFENSFRQTEIEMRRAEIKEVGTHDE